MNRFHILLFVGFFCLCSVRTYAQREQLIDTADILAPDPEKKHSLNEVTLVPEFPGGTNAMYKYLQKKVKYPASARKLNLEGKVYVEFCINKEGEIEDVKLIKGIKSVAPSPELQSKYDKAGREMESSALKAIAGMPNWSPGQMNGKKVKVKYIIPVAFNLNKK